MTQTEPPRDATRGLGQVQRRVLDYLNCEPRGREDGHPVHVTTTEIVDDVLDQRIVVQRALRSLERRGLVERAPWRSGHPSLWRRT